MKIIGRIFLCAAILIVWVLLVTRLHGTTQTASLLQPSDITYDGCYYDVQVNGQDSSYGQGLASRYVNGDLRFLSINLNGTLYEMSLAGHSCGDTITTRTNLWDLGPLDVLHNFTGIWWNEAKSELWINGAQDYTVNVNPVELFTLKLNDNGTTGALHGPIGLAGLNMKRTYGGFAAVPAWFQVQYGVGPYVTGFGGYTSLVAQGGGASMGLTAYGIPDLSGYANGTQLAVGTQYKVIADHYGTGSTDWYAAGVPTTSDRGARFTNPINYYDGGDPRQNPSTAPTIPPVDGAQWLSPSPDGHGRFVWGDSFYNTLVWIDTPTKRGIVAFLNACDGMCYYMNSTLNSQRRISELQIFDPAQWGEAALGHVPPWKVQPVSGARLTLPGIGADGAPGGQGNSPVGAISGAIFDPTTNKIYGMGFATGQDIYYNRLYRFSVNTGSTPPPVDSDGDGVPDTADLCPGTPAGTAVDATGCPLPPPPLNAPLTVVVNGPGTVMSAPAGISCPPTCLQSFPSGTVLLLTATAGASASLSGWSAPCAGMTVCTLTLTAPTTVTATFVAVIPPADSDGDGVPDSNDLCPGTPMGTPVDTTGCPISSTVQVVVKAKTCTVTVSDDPPDVLGGWRVQFTKDGGSFGSSDSSAPYTRSATINAGTYQMGDIWTKTGQAMVTRVLGQAVCQVK